MPSLSATLYGHTATVSGIILQVNSPVADQATAQTILNVMKNIFVNNNVTTDTLQAQYVADPVALS